MSPVYLVLLVIAVYLLIDGSWLSFLPLHGLETGLSVTAQSISLRFLDTMLLGDFLSQPGHLLKRKLGTLAPMSQQPHSQRSGWLLCSLGGVWCMHLPEKVVACKSGFLFICKTLISMNLHQLSHI